MQSYTSHRTKNYQFVGCLPAFDHYVFAAGLRRGHVLPDDFHARVYRSQGSFSPVLAVDGRMDGVWRFESEREAGSGEDRTVCWLDGEGEAQAGKRQKGLRRLWKRNWN